MRIEEEIEVNLERWDKIIERIHEDVERLRRLEKRLAKRRENDVNPKTE